MSAGFDVGTTHMLDQTYAAYREQLLGLLDVFKAGDITHEERFIFAAITISEHLAATQISAFLACAMVELLRMERGATGE